MMAEVVVAWQEFGLAVSESKTGSMRPWSVSSSAGTTLYISAPGKRYKQTTVSVYLVDAMGADANIYVEIDGRINAVWARLRKYFLQLYDRLNAQLSMQVQLLEAEVVEALLYGCATWTLRFEDFDSMHIAHHKLMVARG